MSALERLARVQRELTAAVITGSVLWGASTAVALLAVVAVADRALTLPLELRSATPWLAALAAVVAATWRVRRAGPFANPRAVALWVERTEPALRYALVTRVDPAGAASADALERAIARVAFEEPARRAAWRPLLRPAAALAAGVVVLFALPAGAVARIARPAAGDIIKARRGAGDALAHVAVTVTPPAYSGIAPTTIDDASRVSALVGSAVRVVGAAVGEPVAAHADSVRVQLAEAGLKWTADVTMPVAPSVVHFVQGTHERLLLLEPRADSAPTVSLTAPARDSVLKVATGTLRLAASARDDIGLDHGAFEVVISSGEGENFRFRTLTIARAALGNARTATLGGAIRLDTLKLEPGDLLHVRAIALDRNTVGGPGLGSSETRAIRIARAGEYDSVDVDAAPPPEERKGVISERMLILLAEKLEKQRAQLAREAFVGQARVIARDQNTLRKQVGNIIFSRLSGDPVDEKEGDDDPKRANMTPEQLLAAANAATEAAGAEPLDFAGGESPVVNINRPLLEAYNAMWEAGRELGVADVKRALPHMYVALAAIQKARSAERVYLRGRPKDAVVDIARVRLSGKSDIIGPSSRLPRGNLDAAAIARLARFDVALGILGTRPAAATDSLLLLRAELLGAAPTLAAPLGDALDQLRAGKDATEALIAARRTLAGVSAHAAPLGAWGRAP